MDCCECGNEPSVSEKNMGNFLSSLEHVGLCRGALPQAVIECYQSHVRCLPFLIGN